MSRRPRRRAAKAAYGNGVLTLHIASAAHTKPGKIALSLGARKQLTPWRPSAACPAEILHARQADPYGDTPVVTSSATTTKRPSGSSTRQVVRAVLEHYEDV